MDCYNCKDWKQGREDGTCINYIKNNCPYGYYDKNKELLEDLRLEQMEQM